MPFIKLLTLPQLRQQAESWDQLWLRSDARLPTQRAEGVALWCDTFARGDEFVGIVVQNHDRWIAALPLVRSKLMKVPAYRLTWNHSVNSGDFLLDPDCNVDVTVDLVANALRNLPGQMAALEGIEIESDRWRKLFDALSRSGCEHHISSPNPVGVVDIRDDWQAYKASWSRNHRSAIKRCIKKLESQGTVRVERMRRPSDNVLHETMESCFAIEDLGWKGREGTSILKVPGFREYYHREARMMRDCGMLDLWLLRLNERIIAFEYCHFAKATCFSHKISFDPDYERFSPGRVLRAYQLQQYHDDPEARLLDTLGLLCEAKAKWCTRTYNTSRCFVSIGGRASNLALRGFKLARKLRNEYRRPPESEPVIEPGASRYLETSHEKQPPVMVPLVNVSPVEGIPVSG